MFIKERNYINYRINNKKDYNKKKLNFNHYIQTLVNRTLFIYELKVTKNIVILIKKEKKKKSFKKQYTDK